MLIGFHMQNGFKTIKIEEVNLYGRKTWNFHFFINNTLYETKNTDDKCRYIAHLQKEYYFEDVDDFVINNGKNGYGDIVYDEQLISGGFSI